MAQKKPKKKRSWLRRVLFYLLFPIVVWTAAFLVWFYWPDLTQNFSKPAAKPTASVKPEAKVERPDTGKADKTEVPAANRSSEKLADEEREKLDAILKRLQQRKAANE